MHTQRNHAGSRAVALCAAVLYPVFLVASTLFVVPVTLLQQVFANRADTNLKPLHRTRQFVLIDVLATVFTYGMADYLRCAFWQRREWPETVPGYGSTFTIHMIMLGMLVIAWPSVLYWLGWYRARRRTLEWKLRNTASAAALLAMVMSACALVAFRDIYPRTQIVFTVVALPILTGIVRMLATGADRLHHRTRDASISPDPAW